MKDFKRTKLACFVERSRASEVHPIASSDPENAATTDAATEKFIISISLAI